MKIKLLCIACATLLSEDKQTTFQSVSFEPTYPDKLPEGFTKANDLLLKDGIEFTIKNKELFDQFKTGESYEMEVSKLLSMQKNSDQKPARAEAIKLLKDIQVMLFDFKGYVNGSKKLSKTQITDGITATGFECEQYLNKFEDEDAPEINTESTNQ